MAYEDLYPSAGDADGPGPGLNDYVLHIHNEEDLNKKTYQHVARGKKQAKVFPVPDAAYQIGSIPFTYAAYSTVAYEDLYAAYYLDSNNFPWAAYILVPGAWK
ncbi:hypothetical protein, partial [Klebsiella pneumoniae]